MKSANPGLGTGPDTGSGPATPAATRTSEATLAGGPIAPRDPWGVEPANQERNDLQKAANDNFEVGALSGALAPEALLSWRDPKTGLPASQDTVNNVGDWLTNPVRAAPPVFG